jgi:hypothetical protein
MRLFQARRIWDRSEIRPFSPVYTRIRPVRGSQIRPVPWFSCVYTAETDEFHQPRSQHLTADTALPEALAKTKKRSDLIGRMKTMDAEIEHELVLINIADYRST